MNLSARIRPAPDTPGGFFFFYASVSPGSVAT